MSTLIWAAISLVGLVVCVVSIRRLWNERTGLPTLTGVEGWAQIGVGRDIAQHWTRLAMNIAAGVFCVLVIVGAMLELVTGGS